MKTFLRLLLPLMLASFACSLAADGTAENRDTRPVLNEDAPVIAFISPLTNNRYAFGTPITLYVEAEDIRTGIARIEFYDNFDEVIDTVTAPNAAGVPRLTASVEWTPSLAQRHFVRARAFRADGTASPSVEAIIEVVDIGNLPAAPSTSSTQVQPQSTEEVTDATPQSSTTQPSTDNIQASPNITQATSDTNAQAAAPIETEEAAPTTLQATVNAEALQVRVSPNQTAMPVTVLTSGQTIQLVGRSADNLWYATPMQTGGFGWVFGNLLEINGDPSTLPLATTE